MKKRCLLYLAVLAVCLNFAGALTESHSTKANSLLLITMPEIALVNSEFEITARYYFTNQQVAEVEISFLKNGQVFKKSAHLSSNNPELTYVLKEAQTATFPYSILVKERLENGEIAESSYEIQISVISDSIDAVKSRHEFVMVSRTDKLYFDDLSIYEPYSLRDKMKYSIVQHNPTKVACSMDGSIILFEPAEGWTGLTSCKAKGEFGNISITHTYELRVMADKALNITGLDDVFLDDVTDDEIIYENITEFCRYQFEPRQKPYIYLASDPKGFSLEINQGHLVIKNITGELGKHLIKLGCNGEFREFYLNVNTQESGRFEISLTRQGGKETLDFGIGTLELEVPASAAGENNTATAIINLSSPELHSFERAFLIDLEQGTEFQEKTCSKYPCRLDFGLFSLEPGLKQYALILEIKNEKALSLERIEQEYIINSSGERFTVKKIFKTEFREKPTDAFSGIRNDLGIITLPLTSESELALKEILSLAGEFSLAEETARLAKTFELIEAQKIIGTSAKVTGLGERSENAVIKIIIKPKQKLSKLTVFEYIPKENAESIGNIEFYNSVLESHGGSFQIIDADPLIAWHFKDLDSEIELKYELDKETSIIGNTIIFAEAEASGSAAYLGALFIAILALLALIVYWRKKGRVQKKNDAVLKKSEKDAREMNELFRQEEHDFESLLGKEHVKKAEARQKLKKVKLYIESRLKAGHKKDEIIMGLQNKGWPAEITNKIIKRLKK